MKMEVEVPEYSSETGMKLVWEEGAILIANLSQEVVNLKANPEGLLSLARHLMALAQESVPVGSHIHLDSSNAFEEGSCELIVEKIS